MRIITGCSRSGTSFICQALHHLGADFGSGDELIAGDEWNKRGYFENRAVNHLNHRLLFGRWSDPSLWIDVMWPRGRPLLHARKLATVALGPLLSHPALIRRRGRRRRDDMSQLGRSLHGKVVKDPRFSYLMQPWENTGTVHSVLYVVRHPTESAASMARQTKLPMKLTYTGWCDAIHKFWRKPPECRVVIVDYNAFFDESTRDAEMRALTTFLGRDHPQGLTEETLSRVLDQRLRTRKAASSPPPPRRAATLYQEVLERKEAQRR